MFFSYLTTAMSNLNKIVIHKPFKGKKLDICHKGVKKYLLATEEKKVCKLLQTFNAKEMDKQNIVICWDGGKSPYNLHISCNLQFTSERIINLNQSFWQADLLFPNRTYYYKIVDCNGVSSVVDYFTTTSFYLRPITIGCAVNVRDCGGWITENNQIVKYDKLYRGGRLDFSRKIEQDEEAIKHLNIKTEIDLRNPGGDDGGQTESSFGNQTAYVRAPITQGCYIFPFFKQSQPYEREHDGRIPRSLRLVFEYLADEKNYPIYFHCNAGADRTGTFAFLLNGLLGVSYEYLIKDFELTTFSEIGFRLRSEIKEGVFTDSGVMQDNYYNYVAFGKTYNLMMSAYSTKSGKLQDSIKRYLVEVCDVTIENIEKFIKIML